MAKVKNPANGGKVTGKVTGVNGSVKTQFTKKTSRSNQAKSVATRKKNIKENKSFAVAFEEELEKLGESITDPIAWLAQKTVEYLIENPDDQQARNTILDRLDGKPFQRVQLVAKADDDVVQIMLPANGRSHNK